MLKIKYGSGGVEEEETKPQPSLPDIARAFSRSRLGIRGALLMGVGGDEDDELF